MSSGGHRDLSNLMDISKLLSEESNNNDGLEKELESSTVLTVKAEITPQVRDLTLYIMECIHYRLQNHQKAKKAKSCGHAIVLHFLSIANYTFFAAKHRD